MENFGASGSSKASVAPRTIFERSALVHRLQQQIVRPPQRQQPARDGVLGVLGAGHVAQALGGNRADRRQRVLDAMVQFFQDQLLQLVGGRALAGVDAGLVEQSLLISACASSSRRLTFSAARNSCGGAAPSLKCRWS